MLEDKIILQDRGFDAGLAALMQNANKGMDPAALMAMNTEKEPEKEDPRIQELQDQVRELKDLIKQASNMVPPQMKQMLPQNMQKAMNEAS